MKIKHLMIIKAIICLGFGIPMLAIPAELMSLYGLTLDPNGVVMARLYGGALFGNLLLTWFSRNDPGSPTLHAAILYLFVYDGINFFVTLTAALSGIMNTFGWSAVAIYLFFEEKGISPILSISASCPRTGSERASFST